MLVGRWSIISCTIIGVCLISIEERIHIWLIVAMEEKILSCLFSLYTYIYYMHYEQFLHTRVDAAGRNHEQQLFLVDMKQDLAA